MRRSGLLSGYALALAVVASAGADEFWTHWGDGRAELSGYRLVQPRDGAKRTGPRRSSGREFSDSLRVEPAEEHPKSDCTSAPGERHP
jgi:hypothetical protein